MAARPNVAHGARMRTVDLSAFFDWPGRVPREKFWQDLAKLVRGYPTGPRRPWGIRFRMAEGGGPRVIMATKDRPAVTVPLSGRADFICLLHAWFQKPEEIRRETPTEGTVVAEYEVLYRDGSRRVLPVRARFEVGMVESPGPPWVAVGFNMPQAANPAKPPGDAQWGRMQFGISPKPRDWQGHAPLVCAMENPRPDEPLRSLTIRGCRASPLLVAGVTLYQGSDNPLRHLPRRTFRVATPGGPARVLRAEVDLGVVTRVEHTTGQRGPEWLRSPYAGVMKEDPVGGGEDLIEAAAAQDATMTVTVPGRRRLAFSVGEAFGRGRSRCGDASLTVLGRDRQWMRVTVVDADTGRPTPVRLHMSGSRGEYLPPYGHHAQIVTNWFEDYGADVVVGGRPYAYVPGEFTTDLPVGDVYVEITKGYEYAPLRGRVRIRPGQKDLRLTVRRWKDLRREGWVTADTHVHFISPHTAWLEGQAEGVNVVNLLASQWGRLFTNVGDLTGRPGVVENDTIVFVGTENRNHMLGHMSMLGTAGLPVFPMCCGGVTESWIGDPDFRAMAEWALENRRKGGLVIRPHFPSCGHTEDPVPIMRGLVDALEIRGLRGQDFPTQEWYRYLNCGYRVAVCGGTDKMSAGTALGWLRTYARLTPRREFTYDAWVEAVRAGRTMATTGPLIALTVEGREPGDSLDLPAGGGTVSVEAWAGCYAPLGLLEVVVNGRVAAEARAPRGARTLEVRERVHVPAGGWIAARCAGCEGRPAEYMAAHTSPVYVRCGRRRAFDSPAAEHMLALVEGGVEYLNKLATVFDESSRRRMVKLYRETQEVLLRRLRTEGARMPASP